MKPQVAVAPELAGQVESVVAAAALVCGPERAAQLGVPVGTRVDPYTLRPLDDGVSVTVAEWRRRRGVRAIAARARALFGL